MGQRTGAATPDGRRARRRRLTATAGLGVAMACVAANGAQAQAIATTTWSTAGNGAYVSGVTSLLNCADYNLCNGLTTQQTWNNELS